MCLLWLFLIRFFTTKALRALLLNRLLLKLNFEPLHNASFSIRNNSFLVLNELLNIVDKISPDHN